MQEITGPHLKVSEIADKLMNTSMSTTQLAALAAQRAGNGGRIDAIYVAAAGAIGGLHVLASLLGHHGDANRPEIKPQDITNLVNPTSTLLAAILCQTMAPASHALHHEKEGAVMECQISFGPKIIQEAIQQVERITGRPVNGQVNELMLRALRKAAESSDEPLSQFLAQRRSAPGGLH